MAHIATWLPLLEELVNVLLLQDEGQREVLDVERQVR